MKQLLSTTLLLLLSLCLLCGCTTADTSDTLSNLQSATLFDASDGTLLFSVTLTGQGGIFRFSEPEILRELTVTMTDGGCNASYNGLESDVPDTFLAAVLPLYRAIRAFQSGNAKRANDAWEITQDEQTYRLYEETQDGMTARIDIETKNGNRSYTLSPCLVKED